MTAQNPAPAAQPMKILWLTKRRYMDKDLLVERYGRYFELPRHLAQRGHSVQLLVLSYRGEAAERLELAPGLSAESIDVRRGLGYGYWRRARQLLRRPGFSHVVGGSDMHFCAMAVHLGRRHGLMTVCDLYDHYYDFASNRVPLFRAAFEWALRHSSVNVAFTEEIIPMHRRRSPQARYEVIPPSLDRSVFRPMDRAACRQQLGLPSEGTLIGYCGAVKAIRGLDTVVEAVARLRRDGHRVTLVVAGPGDGSLDLEGRQGVICLGHLPQAQVPVVLNACHLNVECRQAIAAADYCFPHKTLEYIACGVPLLMPDVQSMARYLADYPEYLYRTADAEDLASKIVALLARSDYRYPNIESWGELAGRYEALLLDAAGTACEARGPGVASTASRSPSGKVSRAVRREALTSRPPARSKA